MCNSKTIFIDIEIVDAQLDYNILLGCIYMYVIEDVESIFFHFMMFLHQ
jgi:hypothetical protein